jgi:hypothetical protein
MLSSVAKQKALDYKKLFDDFREDSFDHLEDYEIDNIDKNCDEFLKDDREVKKIVRKTIRFDIYIMGILFLLTIILYYACFYVFNEPTYNIYFIYFVLATLFLEFYWFFFISPIRTHQLRDKNGKINDKLFIKYRGIITPGTSIKKQLSDNRIQFVAFGCILAGILIIFSVQQDYPVLYYLNVAYRSYTGARINTIESTIPVLIVLFMIANIIAIIAIMSYDKKNTITDEKLTKIHSKKLILIGIVLALFIANIIFSVQNAKVSSRLWENTNIVTTKNIADFNAAWVTFFLYFFIYLGAAAIGILCLLGLSGLEGGYIKMLYRQKIERLPPEEDNWEFHKTTERHMAEKHCINKTRIYSLIELVVMLAAAVGGYWTLWIYADPAVFDNSPTIKNDILFYTAGIILLIIILWWIIISPYFHYRREKKFYFKDPHLNWRTAMFEERGLGSWRTYYREDKKKHKTLIAYLLYFNIIGLWGLTWDNGGGEGIVASIFSAVGLSENAVLPAMTVFYFAWNFLFLLYTGYMTLYDNSTEGKVYKVLLFLVIGFFTFGTIGIINSFESHFVSFNWGSFDFILGLLLVIAFFGILGFLLVFFIFPVAIRFDNFEVVKKDIAVIMISTIIFMAIFAAFFDLFLPMVDVTGSELRHGYPFRSGADWDASVRWNNFILPLYLIGWYGYLWWGFVQQFLFMSYFLRLLYRGFPNSKGFLPAGLSSLIFGIIHFPDWPLMLFTGVAGLMWAYFWQKWYINKDGKEIRGNNLYIWGMIHGMGGTFVSHLIPISMSVGPFNA